MAVSLPDFGESIDVSTFAVQRARAVADFLRGGRAKYAHFVGAHRDSEGVETIVVRVEVEVPQAPVHEIQPTEQVAIRFSPDDRWCPTVLALRRDFPAVSHLHLTSQEYPKSLCLYEQPWVEVRLRWTPASFIERIREWMALTARGELHGADQPLEPILLHWEHMLVLPYGAFRDAVVDSPVRLLVDLVAPEGGRGVLVARGLGAPQPPADSAKFVATLFTCDPQPHGVIRRSPQNLEELHHLAAAAGLDLKERLQRTLKGWRELRDTHQAKLIVLLALPKTRDLGAPVERNDLWAFALHKPIGELGPVLGAWARDGKLLVPLVGPSPAIGSCESVPVSVLNPVWSLTPEAAARSNGLPARDARRIVSIGAGALGSQVYMNLTRCGFGTWTVIDNDSLLPHNLARHALDGFAIGWPKAMAVAQQAQSIVDSDARPVPIVADFLEPGDKGPAIDKALEEAQCVLDLSASVPVARALARASRGSARRVSLFLNPSGTDLVMLAEDEARNTRLDHLEHQLYREVLRNTSLSEHFSRPSVPIRYAQSCRDLSSTLPQHLAGLHAAIGSKAIRDVVSVPAASIRIWHADSDLNVTSITVPVQSVVEQKTGPWTICSDEGFLARIRSLRSNKLPNETGGVLLGSFDLERQIVYIVDTIPSPPDSEEWPTLYIRGAAGLANGVKRVSERTGGMLQYVGEWHSHPRDVPPLPSHDDCQVFAWLTELMDRDGFPAIMLIAGDTRESIFVGCMIQGREPS